MEPQTLREKLLRLATNYRWTWTPSCEDLLRSLPGSDVSTHPIETVRGLSDAQIGALTGDVLFRARVDYEISALGDGVASPPDIAYFSAEFGVSHHALQYAGGLGVLADRKGSREKKASFW